MKKILVFSDVHGHTHNLMKLVPEMEKADYVFFLGDGLTTLEILPPHLNKKLICIRGNWEMLNTKLPLEKVIQVEDAIFFLSHGHYFLNSFSLQRLKKLTKEYGATVCLYGHTHTYYYEEDNGVQYINCPQLGTRQRIGKEGGQMNSYLWLEVNGKEVVHKMIDLGISQTTED